MIHWSAWQEWGTSLRQAREHRVRLERRLRWGLVVVAAAGVGWVAVDGRITPAALLALAVWAAGVAWLLARAAAVALTRQRRRRVLAKVRQRTAPVTRGAAPDVLENLVVVGQATHEGRLLEATQDGDQVVVTRRDIPDAWLEGWSGDPPVPQGPH